MHQPDEHDDAETTERTLRRTRRFRMKLDNNGSPTIYSVMVADGDYDPDKSFVFVMDAQDLPF